MVWKLAKALDQIREIQSQYANHVINGIGHNLVGPNEAVRIKGFAIYWRMQFEAAELQVAVDRIDGPLRISLMSKVTHETLANEFRVLRETAEHELQHRRFIYIPERLAKVHDRVSVDWELPWTKIAACKEDAQDAVDCYVVGKNEACVFHLMRVAEHCLRTFSRRLRVNLTHNRKPQPIELATWHKIIDGCNVQIAKARALNPSAKKQERLSLYSDAAQHCMFMKDIWRNEISHTGKRYTEAEALSVLNRVRDFAVFIAARVLS